MQDFDIPDDILAAANTIRLNLLPDKSKIHYEKEYRQFCEWRNKVHVQGAEETVLLAYFAKLSEEYSASSLWPKYSMLRATLELKERVEIDKYGALIRFIKKKNVGYKAKKSKVFTREQVNEFVRSAPDEEFLMMKVAFLIGIGGACRTNELAKMTTEDVDVLEDKLVVTIPDSKTHKKRIFAVVSDGEVNPVLLFKKYAILRPVHVTHRRLFVSYRKGKCTVQPCGIHFFSKIPQKIAEYLSLENPNMYTGHCVRRSSANFLVNAGGDILDLQELGGWESAKVARGYLEESISKKVSIARKIQIGDVSGSGLSTGEPHEIERSACSVINQSSEDIPMIVDAKGKGVSIKFENCQNIVLHVHEN